MVCVLKEGGAAPRTASPPEGNADRVASASYLGVGGSSGSPSTAALLQQSPCQLGPWWAGSCSVEVLSIVEKREGVLGGGGAGGWLSRSFLSKNRRKQIGTNSRALLCLTAQTRM